MEDRDLQPIEQPLFIKDCNEMKDCQVTMNGDIGYEPNDSNYENDKQTAISYETKSEKENDVNNISDDHTEIDISGKSNVQDDGHQTNNDTTQVNDSTITNNAIINDDHNENHHFHFQNKHGDLPVIIVEEQTQSGASDNDQVSTISDNDTTGDHYSSQDDNQEPSATVLNSYDDDNSAVGNHEIPTDKDNYNNNSCIDNENTSHIISTDNDVNASAASNCQTSESSFQNEQAPESQSSVTTLNPDTDNPPPDNLIYKPEYSGSNNRGLEGQGVNDDEPANTDSVFVSQETGQESSTGCVDFDSNEEVYDSQHIDSSGIKRENENKEETFDRLVSGDLTEEKKNAGEDSVSCDVDDRVENVDKYDLVNNETEEPRSDQINESGKDKVEVFKTLLLSPSSESDNKTSFQSAENSTGEEKCEVDGHLLNKVEPPILQSSQNTERETNQEEFQTIKESESQHKQHQTHDDDVDNGDCEKVEVEELERQNITTVSNSQDNSKSNLLYAEEREQGEEDPIDRDKVTAFVNEITHKAVVTYSQNISQEEDEDQEENKKDETEKISDIELGNCDKVNETEEREFNSEHTEKNESEEREKSDDIDEKLEQETKQNIYQEEREQTSGSPVIQHENDRKSSINSSGSLEQQRDLQHPLEEDQFVDNNSGVVVGTSASQSNFEDLREYSKRDYSDTSSISSSISSNMNDDNCRPKSRPKSSHPRKRGQQDTDHEGIPHARLSPNQRQSKIHKNEQDERSNTAIDIAFDNSAGDVFLDQQTIEFDENRESIPPDTKQNDSDIFQNEDDEEAVDSRLSALPSSERNASENGWADAVSVSPSSNGHHNHEDKNKMDSSRMSLTSGDRISRISDAADNISYMQNSLQDMFREAKGILSDYQSQLKDQPIAEFSEDVPEFTRAFSSLSDAYRACENVTGGINEQLQGIRTMTNEICDLITYKTSSQGLTDLMQDDIDESSEKELTREQREAVRKEQQARLQEIKAITAKAAAQALTAYELAAQAEVEATQAEVAATNARQEADIAMKRIEEATLAAEKRRLEEEEKTRIAEEKARKKAEEEKRRKEKEERRIAREAERKGTSLEEERKRAQEEKARLEAERKNPNNWPRYIYSIDGADWNPGVGLILRAQQGCLDREELQITLVDQMDNRLPLGENEELISNIICLTPVNEDKAYKFDEPMSVSIPHCCPRFVPGREPVVKLMTSDGKISILNTHDLMFDDIKELKFVEVRMRQFGTMAVFLRPKKEQLTLDRMGGKVMSSVDSRVTITSCENAFKTNVTFTVEVQPIDQNLVLELKAKKPLECDDLMSTSPLVNVNMKSQFHKPLTLTLPCPHNPALRPRRPQTAGNRLSLSTTDKKEATERPLSARPFFQGKDDTDAIPDQVHLLRKDGGGSWFKADDIELTQAKKKDVVTFDMINPFNKLVLIRTKAGLTNAKVERILGHVIMALTFKPVSVVMRQKSSDPNCVTVTCTQSTNVDRVIKALGEEGYDHGPKPSPDIHLTEGQRLALKFRGNLILMDEFSRSNFLFYNHLPFRLSFTVTEHDKYAQKGFDSYRGFSQILTRGKVRKPSMAVDDRDRVTGQKIKDEFVDGDVLLCEHLIIIPKPYPETPRPLNVAPVSLTSDGVVNDEMLRFLSTHLQNNDWKKVAAMLNVKRSRIQAILRQNINNSTPQTVYDVLVSWSKRLPRAVNRTDILCNTLSSVGRDDLAEELRVRDEEYKQARTARARESYLSKAFVAIARNPLAVTQWKYLARYLDVGDEEISQIEATTNGCQESCLASLTRWKENKGEEATIPLLANKLRRCRYRRLAREIEDIR